MADNDMTDVQDGGAVPAMLPPGGANPLAPGLYVVATPLGHLGDLAPRAAGVLRAADRIYAEDTRVTAGLLARAGVMARSQSLHAHNEARRTQEVVDAVGKGLAVALVSDAGTPAISDPGARVVRAVLDAGFRVVPVAGPSAVAAAVSAAGLHAERFAFIGFLPERAKAQRALLGSVARLPLALVIYEAPHRVRATLERLAVSLGSDRTVVIARELTKQFEEIARLPLGEAQAWIAGSAWRERGEFVLIVDVAPVAVEADSPSESSDDPDPVTLRWLDALAEELTPAQAARIAAKATGIPRAALYRALLPGQANEDE